jgi:prepilin-type N-terminal cleavage/methylation domain-containing protein
MNNISLSRELNIFRNQWGFTLIELMIGIVVSAITITAGLKIYDHMQNSSVQQVEISMLQQNQRGVLTILERELRLIGMDMKQSKKFGITDVRKFTITSPGVNATPSAAGSPILQMTMDLNNDKIINAGETVTYALYDQDNDGQPPFALARSTAYSIPNLINGRQLLAEGIQAIGFAYAFDADGDGIIDRKVVVPGDPPSIIWAVDSNNDGLLDADLAGGALPGGVTVPTKAIRAVQFWILGMAQRPDSSYTDTNTYSVGGQPPIIPNDQFRRWLLTEIVHCRNL